MLEFGLFLVTCGVIGGIVALIEWNGKREKRRRESVKSSPLAPPIIMPSTVPESYVVPPSQTTDTTPAIPKPVSVSGTGITDFDPAAIPSDLTYEEMVTILAGQMTPEGKPKYSGKKIYSWVGGNYNEFTVLMRRLRSKDDAPAEPPVVNTPIAERPTSAQFISDLPH